MDLVYSESTFIRFGQIVAKVTLISNTEASAVTTPYPTAEQVPVEVF